LLLTASKLKSASRKLDPNRLLSIGRLSMQAQEWSINIADAALSLRTVHGYTVSCNHV
jgi:hypothetical protein